MNQYKPYMWALDWDLDQIADSLRVHTTCTVCEKDKNWSKCLEMWEKKEISCIYVYIYIGREKVPRSEPSLNAVQQCTLLRGSQHQPLTRINAKTCLNISCLKIHSGRWNRNHFNEEMQLGIRLLLRRHTVAAIAIATIGSTPNGAAGKRQGYNSQSQKATARITETIGQWPYQHQILFESQKGFQNVRCFFRNCFINSHPFFLEEASPAILKQCESYEYKKNSFGCFIQWTLKICWLALSVSWKRPIKRRITTQWIWLKNLTIA